MLENGKNEYIFKKSYEIAYALWRVAANITEPSLAEKIGQKAIDLIGYASEEDTEKVLEKMPGIELILRFGADVNAISLGNYEILSQEISNLKSAILDIDFQKNTPESNRSFKDLMKKKDMSIFDVFLQENRLAEIEDITLDDLPENESGTQIETGLPESYGVENFFKEVGLVEIEPIHAQKEYSQSEMEPINSDSNPSNNYPEPTVGKAEIRQSAILERIRKIGNCQLGDIQVILPETSERTIRYDLEALVQRKLIERVGTGGRGVYYKMAADGY